MHSAEKSNKCNQCDYASSQVGHLRTHLKTHSGEKPNKCNQCGFASSDASSLRTHLNMLNGEKSNKWKMGIFSHFQLPENGTSSTQIQKRRPLFHANIPPKWWNRYLFCASDSLQVVPACKTQMLMFSFSRDVVLKYPLK